MVASCLSRRGMLKQISAFSDLNMNDLLQNQQIAIASCYTKTLRIFQKKQISDKNKIRISDNSERWIVFILVTLHFYWLLTIQSMLIMEIQTLETIQHLTQRLRTHLPEKSVERLGQILVHRHFDKDEQIVTPGQVSRNIYIVVKGILRLYYYKGSRNITEHFSCEEALAFCIESMFANKPSELCIEAIEESDVYMIDYSRLKELAAQDPHINDLLIAILEQDLIESQYKADSWRFETAHERYDRFCREYPQAARRASVAHIASYLLMAPETLSRVRAGLL